MEFQQSEQINLRRRWILVLVDSADGVTGKTGQIGTVEISKNGGTPAVSTNNIVEVDAVNMPGHYYIELTAGELSDLGMISIYYKASGTLAFHDRGYVTYNNPFQSTGGFATAAMGTSGKGGLTKPQATALLKSIREIIQEELAKDEQEDNVEEVVEDTRLDQILEAVTKELELPKPVDLTPVLDAVGAIMPPNDYSKEFKNLATQLTAMGKLAKLDVVGFTKAITDFQAKMSIATKDINGSMSEVKAIKDGYMELKKLMNEFQKTLAEQSDMDKRFDAMNSSNNNNKLETLTKQVTKMAVLLTDLKYDLKIQNLK